MIIVSNTYQCKLFFERKVVLRSSQTGRVVSRLRTDGLDKMRQKLFWRLVLGWLLLLSAANLQASPVTAMDIVGREVPLQQPAKKVILADARAIQA